MRILYIGDFKEKYSTERYIIHALQELGHEVLAKQEGNMFITNPDNIIGDIIEHAPAFVLFSKGKPKGNAKGFMAGLKKAGIPTCTWLFDLYFDLPIDRAWRLRAKDVPFNADVIYTTDGGHHKQFEELGFVAKTLRQGIHGPEAILYDREKVHDVIFVGGDVYHTRGELFETLSEKYMFERFGDRPDNQIRGLALNELYATTKIVVGDSQPSPHYWSNRVYETLGRGGFLLHPKTEGMEEEFIDGVHLVFYERGNKEDLCNKIDYYLKHDEEREKIRRAGFEHVKNNYTYKHRCIELLKNYE